MDSLLRFPQSSQLGSEALDGIVVDVSVIEMFKEWE